MKLRIKGNSVRLRLTQSDVAEFITNGKLEESLTLGIEPDQKLFYALVSSESAESVSAAFNNGRISVSVPKNEAEIWARGNQTGIGGEQQIDAETILKIAVEKDFACLETRADEDESDNFPHPKAGKIC